VNSYIAELISYDFIKKQTTADEKVEKMEKSPEKGSPEKVREGEEGEIIDDDEIEIKE
jgi:hypothetical protein